MIESMIQNELTLKRWRRFKQRKTAMISLWLLIASVILSFTAELVSNSVPLYLNYKGTSYFPAFKTYSFFSKTYHPKIFGVTDVMVMNFRTLKLSDDDTIIWPIFKWDPLESNKDVDSYPAPPTVINYLGTDDRGRDVLARLLYGFRPSFLYAFIVWVISYFFGIFAGGIMGYFGGRVDFLFQRVIEVFSSIPQFFLILIIISIFTPSLTLLVIITSAFGWIGISYYVRAEFLKNRKREFVEAARALGRSDLSIIFKHILPNSLAPVITFSPFFFTGLISGLAALDYLGFGLPVPTPSWGELLAQAQKHFTTAWWLAVYPSIALFFTLIIVNLIGEGIRDAMDPNMN
jgi:microcin C transport system permease protein